MRTYEKHGWKKNIDPCLDKTAKWFLEFTSLLEKHPKEGHLSFPENYTEDVTGLNWHGLYSGENQEGFFTAMQKAGILDEEAVNVFLKALDSLNSPEILTICTEMVESLPEKESRLFYQRELGRLAKKDFKLTEDLRDKEARDFFSIIFSVLLRYLFVKLQSKHSADISEEDIEREFKKPDVLKTFIGFLFYLFPFIAYQKTIYELMAKFANGDDKSLFKAVTIDKSFLFNEDVKARIIKAQLTGDSLFFKNLGKAISDSPLKRIGQHSKTYFVLSFFWLAGLYKLNSLELHSFLESCNVIPPAHPYAFEKFIERHIKPLYRF